MQYDDIDKDVAAKAIYDKIKNITLINEWFDDHIPCATVNIELYGGTVHENVNFAYVGSAGIAALIYYAYPQAQLDFSNDNIPQILESAIDDGFDYVNTLKLCGKREANQLDIKTALLILELADLDINSFEAE